MVDDGQTEAYLKDTDMTGLASVWAMEAGQPSFPDIRLTSDGSARLLWPVR